jgi:hypothetical protein
VRDDFFRLQHDRLSLQATSGKNAPAEVQFPHGRGGTAEAAQWAVAKVDYIGREAETATGGACGAFLVTGIDGATSPADVRAWMRQEILENERSNGRIGEQCIIALPHAFTPEQRVEAVRRFMALVTENGRIAGFAGVHDRGDDAEKPHAHVVFRDRLSAAERAALKAAGQRVVKGATKLGWLSQMPDREKNAGIGSTERFRMMWAQAANSVFADAGSKIRLDHRSDARQRSDDERGGRNSMTTPESRSIAKLKRANERRLAGATARLDRAVERGKIDELTREAQLEKIREAGVQRIEALEQRWLKSQVRDDLKNGKPVEDYLIKHFGLSPT